ncbi:DUF2652 domain-containing protein [Chryseobacterium arthrosphaerae]|uniref:DUF2652 domain-containing protein n=1 Tax=Chryseobacterium arthrosphaerae TaxID=651561 RepID=UPI001E5FF091|nr:DUF2652 domain-containing protein [Chryseobacterium arthrosphaerae]UEQ78316.1 DUF2652 domain-containing protein [Chryseobacterium arthrosphaerae]
MKTNIQEGIILIPDFSGFTEFVFNTKLYTGEYIVRQLLSILIDVNDQYFEISEIEGDAILFYRYDESPSYKSISKMLWNMRSAFNRKIEELSKSLSTTIDLSLKFIVHYGSFSQYNIGNFRKLYGKTIVEAHQLLKNGVAEQPSYALYSNSFLENSKNQEPECNNDQHHLPEVGVIHYFETLN